MKRITFCLVTILSVAGFSKGQSINDTSKVRIGVNFASFIDKDYDATPLLCLDHNFTTNNHLRFQVGRKTYSRDFDGGNNTGTDSNIFVPNILDTVLNTNKLRSNITAFQLGYFRTVDLGSKTSVYFGLDAIFRINKGSSERNFKTEQVFSSNQKQFFTHASESDFTISRMGLAPMLGLQFEATKRISIAAELQAQILSHKTVKKYKRNERISSTFNPNFNETNIEGTDNIQESTYELLTLSGIFVYIRL